MKRRYDYTDYMDIDSGLVITGKRRFDWWKKEEGLVTKFVREERSYQIVEDVEWVRVTKHFEIIGKQGVMNFNN